MLGEMTAEQFREWMVFNSLEPFWEERIGDLFASVVQVLANIYRDKKKRSAPFDLKDVRLNWGDEGKKGPPDWKLAGQQMRVMAAFLKLQNASADAGRKGRKRG